MDDSRHSNLQATTTQIWDQLYRDYEAGAPVGIQYPTEALVIFVATQRKSGSVTDYFEDKGREYSARNFFEGNALEFGFGSISNLRMVREKGYKCFGLEVSGEAVKRGIDAVQRLGLTGIELKHWKPYDLPFPDNFFQLVYGLGCIYYNLEINRIIDEIDRVLAPGGKFLFSFFSSSHTYMRYLERVDGPLCRWSEEHPNKRLRGAYFVQPSSPEELLQMFSNFSNLRVFKTESDQTPLFESWWYITGTKR